MGQLAEKGEGEEVLSITSKPRPEITTELLSAAHQLKIFASNCAQNVCEKPD